jgi:hypothetical protein
VFFNNGTGQTSIVRVLKLDTVNMTATSVLTYQASGASSFVLGDAQQLPNGNVLVTYSTGRQVHEISASGQLVASYETPNQLGYSEFRDSLYGPPSY